MHFNHKPPQQLCASTQRKGSLIVCGDGPDKHTELEAALAMWPDAQLMSINRGCDTTGHEPSLWCSMHVDTGSLNEKPWAPLPLSLIPEGCFAIGRECNGDHHKRIDLLVDGDPIWGTSTLLGVLSGLWLGYDELLVVGTPLPRHYGSPSKLASWQAWEPYMQGRVQIVGRSKLGGLLPSAIMET